MEQCRRCMHVVPRVGIEPTLLAERDFESRASTNFATEAGACSETQAVRRCQQSRPPLDSRSAAAPDPRMPPLPPVTQALLLDQRRRCSASTICSARLLTRCSRSGRSASGFWPWQVVTLRVPARRLRSTCSSTCWACGCSAASSSTSGGRSATSSSISASVLAAAADATARHCRCSAVAAPTIGASGGAVRAAARRSR